MSEPTYLHSIGHLSCMAETSVPDVQQILDEIGAKPAFVINLVPHYSSEVCGTVIARANGWTDQEAYHKVYFSEVHGDA